MPFAQYPVPFYPSLESRPVDSPLRKLYPEDTFPNGSYFPSPNGRIRYWIIGPSDGPKVTLIHGISAPSLVFSQIANRFANNGFQVLLYDLHGRGYSEAPKEVLATKDYIIQLALLLQYVGWTSTYLVGFSMGGGIAAGVTTSFPHLVNRKVALVAPAGLLDLPINSEGVRVLPRPALPTGPKSLGSELRHLQSEELSGFDKTVQDSMRFGPIANLEKVFESLATTQTAGGPIQVLVVHGTSDEIVPFTEADKIKRLVPQAKVVPVEGASHYITSEEEHAETVASSIIAFLSE